MTALLLVRKVKFGLKIQVNAWGNKWIRYLNTNKKAPTPLCVFPYTSFMLYNFLCAYNNRTQSRLLRLGHTASQYVKNRAIRAHHGHEVINKLF